MSAELFWSQGYTAAEIARRVGRSEATIRTYAKRFGWKRSPEGEMRLQRYLSESGNRGNAERWLGWPPMRGSPEDRDAAFVRAHVREALAAGVLRIVANENPDAGTSGPLPNYGRISKERHASC